MKNKSNVVITIFLVIIVIIGASFLFIKYKSERTAKVPENTPNTTTTIPSEAQNEIAWIKSPKFGLLYPRGFEIIEYYELSPAQVAQGVPETEGAPTFTATSSGNAIITWGGNQSACSQDELENFQYGVSFEACVKNLHALVYPENVRYVLSQDELKIFGDFVLKNK